MKLFEKIEKLDTAVRRLKVLHSKCPDIEIINENNADYYVSKQIIQLATDVEFLSPKSTYNALHKACVFQDFIIEDSKFRVYGIPFQTKLFQVLSEEDDFQCYEYTEKLEQAKINPVALRKIHMYVIDFMRDSGISVNKKSLPDNIKNLLAFI